MWALPSGQHTGPWHHEGHIKRPDTRPIEDPAEPPKITLAKQGAPTHVPDRQSRSTHSTSWPTSGCRPSSARTTRPCPESRWRRWSASPSWVASTSSWRSSRLVTLRSAMGTPRPHRMAWISGTERCSRWRKAPDLRHDVEAELVLRQGQGPLGLWPVRLVATGAALGLAAADLQTQPLGAGERHQGAAVLVADPHRAAAGRAEPAGRAQHPLAIRYARPGSGHRATPRRRLATRA